MSKHSQTIHQPTVIEIDDSTDDDELTNTSDSRSTIGKNQKNQKSVFISTSDDTTEDTTTQDEQPSSSSSNFESKQIPPKNVESSTIPKKILSRRKSMHHSIRSTADMSFECALSHKRRESFDDITTKKTRWNDNQIDDAVDINLNNPEIEDLLKKIAYCRVFTNYLLRQYDMLAIDFKLFSNLDMLNLDLKMRVDTYMAIQKSRQRFKEGRELNNGQVQL